MHGPDKNCVNDAWKAAASNIGVVVVDDDVNFFVVVVVVPTFFVDHDVVVLFVA